jgi:hypothetical protein
MADIKDLMSQSEVLDDDTMAKMLTIINLIRQPDLANPVSVVNQHRHSWQLVRLYRQQGSLPNRV